ncbi:hypothetical protein D3C84_1190520 [compost metagenome]
MVWHIENLNPCLARCCQHPAQVIQRAHGVGDRFGQAIELAAFTQEIVIRVHQQQAAALAWVGHDAASAQSVT